MAVELRALFLLALCFPGLQGQTPEVQRRREGDTLYLLCPYEAWTTKDQEKLWCLLRNGQCKEILHTYYETSMRSRDGRIEIKDNQMSRTVSITMTDLKAEDSDTYFCTAYNSDKRGYPQLRTISLNVFKELLQWELDTLRVQCPAGHGMVWCRGGQSGCTGPLRRQTSPKESEMKSLQDRTSVEYNSQRALVTMRNLQVRDSGVYWCALGPERSRRMEVVLSVFRRTQQHTAKESGNISVQCHYRIADYGTVSKAWCKATQGEMCNVLASTSSESPAGNSTAREGVRIQDDSQQGVVTVTMEQLQVQDSGVYWCALQDGSALLRVEEVTLSVSKALPPGGFPDSESQSEEILLGDSCSGNTFLILSVVLLLLLLLALLTSVALGVRYSRLLLRTGNREAEGTSDRPEGTAQAGSTGRREGSQDDSKGPGYINLDVQSHTSLEEPLYCNVKPSQAPGSCQHMEYAIIAFNQSPRTSRE